LEKIIINVSNFKSEILVGEKWTSVTSLIPDNNVVIITDDNIFKLYENKFPKVPVLTITPGEQSKNLDVISYLTDKLLEIGIDRSGFILAIGGGVVCDMAGFLASIYMRGIRCGYISTSLLSQVDACIGGKNGVNIKNAKNILGTIRQPVFVICDPTMLLTLPDEEYLSGLSELIKTAIIGDKELFELIENNYKKIMARDCDFMSILINKAIKFKASIVIKDEKEIGLRRILNFGHTYGHAIEIQKSMKHGFAVASGMEFAVSFSYDKWFISLNEKNRIIDLLKRLIFLIKIVIFPMNYLNN